MLTLHLRHQELATDAGGRTIWRTVETAQTVDAARLAIIVCDVWDHHWCLGAEQRLALLLPRMQQALAAARDRGAHIIHAPSDTMAFYIGHAARERIAGAAPLSVPAELPHDDPPLPIDASDEGCDTHDCTPHRAWTRQHPAISIDCTRDVITDSGQEVLAYLQRQQIDQVLIMGVHTNMCVLHRTFAIKQLVRWGVAVALVRDLTDAMYNPARPPYVSHEEGTALVVGYIEKHWCPTIDSADLVR